MPHQAAPIPMQQDPPDAFAEQANRDPLAAVSVYERLKADPNTSNATKDQAAEVLHLELAEHGQRILIKYLDGEQQAPSRADFVDGGNYFEAALGLPQASAFDESRMWFFKGRAAIFDRQYADAVASLERSIILDPDHAYAYNALGIAYLEQVPSDPDPRRHEMYDRAVNAFNDALRFAPNWAYPHHNLALAFSEQGDFKSAESQYQDAMKHAPGYSYLPYNLGVLFQRMHRLDDAERLYKQALDQADKNYQRGFVPPVFPWIERADILNGLGTVAAARNKSSEAERYYRYALGDATGLSAAKYNLAVLLSARGPSPEAVDLWRQNINSTDDPSLALASRIALAKYFDEVVRSRYMAAAEYLDVIKIASDNLVARRELARIYTSEQRFQEAYDQLTALRSLSSDDPQIAEDFADVAARLGRFSEAAKAYREAAIGFHTKKDRKRVERSLKSVDGN